jgi:hypothetical protein
MPCAPLKSAGAEAGARFMSNYQIGAFEALEWAWYMLRTLQNKPDGVEDARRIIQDVLSSMGRGDDVDFSEYLRPYVPRVYQQNIMVTP